MVSDEGDGRRVRDAAVAADSDSTVEPEIVRWLEMYAEAGEGRLDATVATILDEVNRLLRRYRRESVVHRTDYGSRLRTLTEHLPVMLWTTDTRLRITTFTGEGLAAVDIDPSSTMSVPLSVVLGADTPSPGAVDAHERALKGQPAVFEYDRRSRSYLAHVQPLADPAGAIVGTIGLAIDVTERKRAEDALVRREQQLAAAHRLARIGSWERDIATGRLTWSDELYRIYGLEPQEIPASFEAFLEFVHPEDAPRVRAITEAAIRSGEPFEYQGRILHRNGAVRHYHSRGVILRDASGRPSRVVGVVQDITERVRAEEVAGIWRERQARLDGMLAAVRELASRVRSSLAAVPESEAVPEPASTTPSALDEAVDAAAALSRALDEIAELQRQIPSE